MNLFAQMRAHVLDAISTLQADDTLPAGLDTRNVAVEPPRDAAYGDMATNAAMVLAKPAGKKPRDVAEALAKVLGDHPDIETAEVAGPGFLNLRLSASLWQSVNQVACPGGRLTALDHEPNKVMKRIMILVHEHDDTDDDNK